MYFKPTVHLARLTACVMDGVTIGHPRCNVDHCVARLDSPRDRFCPGHRKLEHQCAINGCERLTSDNMRTCNLSEHRAYESRKRERGQAIFRLKRRLAGHSTSLAIRSAATDTLPDVPDVLDQPEVAAAFATIDVDDATAGPADLECQEKTPSNKFKTALTRRWTHNDQLLVRCCGIIFSRAVFFEAESMSNSRVR